MWAQKQYDGELGLGSRNVGHDCIARRVGGGFDVVDVLGGLGLEEGGSGANPAKHTYVPVLHVLGHFAKDTGHATKS